MSKTILITGSTDGIGLEAARMLAGAGHTVLFHGRNRAKLDAALALTATGKGQVEGYLADISDMSAVANLADQVMEKHERLDVLINNAGVFRTNSPVTAAGLDVRIAVNTLAPYLLTRRLMPVMDGSSRVVSVSSAAQSPVSLKLLSGQTRASDMEAYSQSKLALAIWSRQLAEAIPDGPVMISINPGSMLGTKMVRDGFGISGGDIAIGARALVRAAVSDDFGQASGAYFDNDAGMFAEPHPSARNSLKSQELVQEMDHLLAEYLE